MDASIAWVFHTECEVPRDVYECLAPGEEVFCAYKTIRDAAIFTNKRLIVRDAQGVTGKKVEVYSLPWSSVNMWSSENSKGIFDFDSEMEFWTKAGHIKIKLKKGIDVRKLDSQLARCIC